MIEKVGITSRANNTGILWKKEQVIQYACIRLAAIACKWLRYVGMLPVACACLRYTHVYGLPYLCAKSIILWRTCYAMAACTRTRENHGLTEISLATIRVSVCLIVPYNKPEM